MNVKGALLAVSGLLGGNSGGGGGGGEAVLVNKTVSANGTYNASSDSADGYKKVTVAVPTPILVSKTVTENGTYDPADDSADGYSAVTVDVAGGWTTDEVVTELGMQGSLVVTTASISDYALYNRKGITAVTGENVTYLGTYALTNCVALTSVHLPNANKTTGSCLSTFSGCTALTAIGAEDLESCYTLGQAMFSKCTNLSVIVLPSAGTVGYQSTNLCSSLTAVDIGASMAVSGGQIFSGAFGTADSLQTLILRRPAIYNLLNINAFAATPFKDGGAGGTLYVPQALIADYQAATNWSTILGYANNQILPIEGSIYETQYADGTPIPTT